MGYLLSEVLNDNKLRKMLDEGACYFKDENGAFHGLEVDLNLVTLSSEKEEAEVEVDVEVEGALALERAFQEWQNSQSDGPCPISLVTKNGVHCFYSDAEGKFVTLDLPESWEEGAPTRPIHGVAEYEVLTWTDSEEQPFAWMDSWKKTFTFGYKFRLEGEETWGFISADFQHITPTHLTNFAITKEANLLASCRKPSEDNEDWDVVDFYFYDFKLGSLVLLKHLDYGIITNEDVLSQVTLEIRSPYRYHRLGRSEKWGGYRNTLLYRTSEYDNTHYIDHITGERYDCTFTYPVVKFWKNDEEGAFTILEYSGRDPLTIATVETALSRPSTPITDDSGASYESYIGARSSEHFFTRSRDRGTLGVSSLDSEEGTLCTILPCQYEVIKRLAQDVEDDWEQALLVLVRKEGYWGVYNISHREFLVPCAFTNITWFSEEQGLLQVERFGKLGLYQVHEDYLLPCAFTDISKNDNGDFLVTRYGKVGICLQSGQQIIPCDYDSIAVKAGRYEVTKLDFTGTLDRAGKWVTPLHREE